VSQQEVGPGLSKAPGTIVLFKLNEHGPALKVFWIRRRRIGRAGGEQKKGKRQKTALNKRKEKSCQIALEPDG